MLEDVDLEVCDGSSPSSRSYFEVDATRQGSSRRDSDAQFGSERTDSDGLMVKNAYVHGLCGSLGRCWCLDGLRPRGGGSLSANVRSLLLVFCVTATFTFAQFVGAYFANSLSMYGDCFTMAVDSVTYLVNIYAESLKCFSEREESLTEAARIERDIRLERIDIRSATVSALSLFGVTAFLLYDAVKRLESEVGVSPVNPEIMYIFSTLNLIMNMVSCTVFCPTWCWCAGILASSTSLDDEDGLHESYQPTSEDADASVDATRLRGGGSISSSSSLATNKGQLNNLNMLSAFVHVAADTCRSLTVFIASLYVWSKGSDGDPVRADAVSSLIVSSLIIFAAIFLSYETCARQKELGQVTAQFSSLSSVEI